MNLVKISQEGHTYVVLNQDSSQNGVGGDNQIELSDELKESSQSNLGNILINKSHGDSTNISVSNDSIDNITNSMNDSNKPSQISLLSSSIQNTKLPSKSGYNELTLKLFSALFYGICSFLITNINKIVLTSYSFPSSNILGVGQMISILIILKVASLFRLVTIRKVSMKNRKMWTLATIYLCNIISGLGGTKHLPLPMFIALRRFSIAMTALGEFYLLHVKQTLSVIMTIVVMIGGSFIAAASDLTFNAIGYILVMANNLFTAANVVYIKKTIDSHEINKHEILYYSALFTIAPLVFICCLTNNLESLYNFEHWTEFGFIISFLASCVMGYLLMFSTILCTHYNSALTTTIVGTLKNILTTYVGMYIGGDYQYSAMNFIGLNISLVGSLVYSYLTFIHKQNKSPTAVKK